MAQRSVFKLYSTGITGSLLQWFTNYLHDRKQRVVLPEANSQLATIWAVIPQGSILGHLLFLLYINNIAEHINSFIRLFADDTNFYIIVDTQLSRFPVGVYRALHRMDLLTWWHLEFLQAHSGGEKKIAHWQNATCIIFLGETLHFHEPWHIKFTTSDWLEKHWTHSIHRTLHQRKIWESKTSTRRWFNFYISTLCVSCDACPDNGMSNDILNSCLYCLPNVLEKRIKTILFYAQPQKVAKVLCYIVRNFEWPSVIRVRSITLIPSEIISLNFTQM